MGNRRIPREIKEVLDIVILGACVGAEVQDTCDASFLGHEKVLTCSIFYCSSSCEPLLRLWTNSYCSSFVTCVYV
jgi:hypothetical protein